MMESSGLVAASGYVSETERRGSKTISVEEVEERRGLTMTKRPSYSGKQVSANWYPVRFSSDAVAART
jgi:hypothetical protein